MLKNQSDKIQSNEKHFINCLQSESNSSLRDGEQVHDDDVLSYSF